MSQKWLVTSLVYLLFGARLAFPSAFAINELGARAQGMGGAFTSIADDASAIFYNPAGIAFQKGTQLEMDSLVVVGLFRFFPSDSPPGSSVPSNGYSGSIKPHFIPVANLYLTKSISRKLTFGFGSFTPFGLSANFTNFNDQDPAGTKYVGRFAGTRARLESFWMQPTLGYQLSENASLGVGIALVHTHLMLESSLLNPYGADTQAFGKALAPAILPGVDPEAAGRAIARLLPEGRSRIAGTSNSPGFSVGFLGKLPRKKTQIGLSFRSAVTHHLKGKASFAFTSTGSLTPFLPSPDTIAKLFPTQDVVGSFTTPASYTVGISNSSFWNTTLSFDFELQDFKRFASIPLNFSQTTNTATPAEQRLNFDFHNSYLVHAGIEKKLKRITAVRAGYLYDHTPVPDKSVGPFFPDSDRHSFTVGATQRVKNMELTLFYQFMQMIDRTVNVAANAAQFTNGDYRNSAHLAGAGLRMYIGRQDR